VTNHLIALNQPVLECSWPGRHGIGMETGAQPLFLFSAFKGWLFPQISKIPYLDPWQRDSSLSIFH